MYNTVKFYPCEPAYVFDAKMVPSEHFTSYEYGTDIFNYLNIRLTPTDIDCIRIDSDGLNVSLVVVYKLDEAIVMNIPPFERIHDDMIF